MSGEEKRERVLYQENHEYAMSGGRKDDFSQFVEQRSKEIADERSGGMSARDLAEKLGIGYE